MERVSIICQVSVSSILSIYCLFFLILIIILVNTVPSLYSLIIFIGFCLDYLFYISKYNSVWSVWSFKMFFGILFQFHRYELDLNISELFKLKKLFMSVNLILIPNSSEISYFELTKQIWCCTIRPKIINLFLWMHLSSISFFFLYVPFLDIFYFFHHNTSSICSIELFCSIFNLFN